MLCTRFCCARAARFSSLLARCLAAISPITIWIASTATMQDLAETLLKTRGGRGEGEGGERKGGRMGRKREVAIKYNNNYYYYLLHIHMINPGFLKKLILFGFFTSFLFISCFALISKSCALNFL